MKKSIFVILAVFLACSILTGKSIEQKIDDLQKAINENPKKVENFGSLGWNYLLNNNPEQALKAVQKGLSLDNSKVWLKTNLGHAYLLMGKIAKAEKVYKEIEKKVFQKNTWGDTTYDKILLDDFLIFDSYGIRNKNIDKVRRRLHQSVDLWQLGIHLEKFTAINKGNHNYTLALEAVNVYLVRLDKETEDKKSDEYFDDLRMKLELRAEFYKEQKNYDEALIDYNKALVIVKRLLNKKDEVIDPDSDDLDLDNLDLELISNDDLIMILTDIAEVYQSHKDYKKAHEYITEGLKIDPKNDSALLRSSKIYIEQKDYAKAIEVLNKAISFRSDYYILYYWRGEAQREAKKL